MSQIYKLRYGSDIELDLFCKMNRAGRGCVSLELYLYIDVLTKQGGIITRILASGMQRSLEPRAKFSAEVMQNYANSAKPMRHTRYFERSTCSKGLVCGEFKNFMPC